MRSSNRVHMAPREYRPTAKGAAAELGAMVLVVAGLVYAIVNAPKKPNPTDKVERSTPTELHPRYIDQIPPSLRSDGNLC